MSELRYREWILASIDSLRLRKARPDLERICRMVRRKHGTEPDRTSLELDRLVQEHAVLKVNYKGSVSYRNAAKVQRGNSRKSSEQNTAKKSSSSTSSSTSLSSSSSSGNNKRASPAELINSDSAQGPDNDLMEDMEDELSTMAGMDSSMDEEDVSLDAPCTQLASAADSGVSLSPVITDPETEVTRAAPTPSKSVSSCRSTPEKDRDTARVSAELAQPAAPQDTGSPELEAALQLAAICPTAQQSTLMREEAPRAGESALTPDQLLSDCSPSPHQDEAVGSDHMEGQKCSNADAVAHTQETETAKNGGMKKGGLFKAEEMAQDLLQWSVGDVVSYFTAVGFPEQAVAFRSQEIDGKSLLLMQRSDVLTGLSIRLGPALKIYEHHVKVLQRSHFQEHSAVFS